MMAGALAVIVAAMLWLGSRVVVRSVVDAELMRLAAAADQLKATLATQSRAIEREVMRVAALPEMARAASALANRGQRDSVRQIFTAQRARQPQVRSIALWSSKGDLLVADGAIPIARDNPPKLTDLPSTSVDRADIGLLTRRGDTVLYTITSPVRGVRNQVVGQLVVTRAINMSATQQALLRGLVGKGAAVQLGNADATLWTNFDKPIPAAQTAPIDAPSGEYRDATGIARLYATTEIPETPWRVSAVVRRDIAVAPAQAFIWKMLVIAAVFTIVGGTLAWLVIRRSLRPLGEVAAAARGIAGGDYSRRVVVRADDELGQLAQSFNAMAGQVEASSNEVAERARLLEATNQGLHDSEQRYRNLIEHSPYGVIVSRDEKILFANPATARVLGLNDSSELVGTSLLDLVKPEDRASVTQRVGKVQREATPSTTREVNLVRKDKRLARIEVTNLPLIVDGKPTVQTILHDVTEQRALEEQLRQAQKMDAVGRLAGGIAHDFNNLLTVIQAHAEFALGDASDATRREDIEEIRRAADSAARLTRQLLTFSRKQVLVPTHIDLNRAIEGMLGMVSRLIGDDIEVVNVAGDTLAGIWADAGQLEQILLNLAINARDAMPDGGVLRFETANVTLGGGYGAPAGRMIPAGDYVMLAVQDTGVGMTEEVRAHIFEPFFTTKQSGRGTGLGLSTVYGIVRQADGYIWVYSEVGRGTTFKIYFPPHAPASDDSIPRFTGEHRVNGLSAHVLVVEDEPAVRSAIRRALTEAKLTVVEATNAAEAIDVLAADPDIDLLITDMVMPGKSGAELVAELAKTHPDLPVVIMSGYSEETASRHWRVPDNASFLEKPVSPKALVEVVGRLLAN